MLEIKDLQKRYPLEDGKEYRVLDHLSMTILKGEKVAVMGASGSGKTTLLNLVCGIDQADSGSIILRSETSESEQYEILGQNKEDMALLRRQKLGLVFQDFNLIDSLSIRENIMLPMVLEQIEEEIQRQRTERLAEIVGITSVLDKDITAVSGGERQRAAICRALVNEPELIIADEPTGNLDRKSTQGVMDNFVRINKELGTSLLMVTHDIYAASYCDRVLLLSEGKIQSEKKKASDRQEFYSDILGLLSEFGGS